jgi:hypothetical protein
MSDSFSGSVASCINLEGQRLHIAKQPRRGERGGVGMLLGFLENIGQGRHTSLRE